MPKRIPEEQIFEAALSVMAERGYAGATTREIAAAAGINEVTLFRRFESKARLLRAAVEGEVSRLEAEHVTEPTEDVAADLERVCRFYAGLLQRRGSCWP